MNAEPKIRRDKGHALPLTFVRRSTGRDSDAVRTASSLLLDGFQIRLENGSNFPPQIKRGNDPIRTATTTKSQRCPLNLTIKLSSPGDHEDEARESQTRKIFKEEIWLNES